MKKKLMLLGRQACLKIPGCEYCAECWAQYSGSYRQWEDDYCASIESLWWSVTWTWQLDLIRESKKELKCFEVSNQGNYWNCDFMDRN